MLSSRRVIVAALFPIALTAGCGSGGSSSDDPEASSPGMYAGTTSAFPPLEPGVVRMTDRDFGELVELKGTPIATDAAFRPVGLGMAIHRDVLILATSDSPGMIKFLSLPDLQLIRQVGVKGHGPGELLFPKLISTSEPGLLCYLYDLEQRKLYEVDTAFVLKEADLSLEKHDGRQFGSEQWIEAGSRQFYYASNSTTGKGIYRYPRDKPDSLKPVFDLKQGFGKSLTWSALIGDFGGNVDRNRLVYAYKYFHQIRFFDLQTSQARTLQFPSVANADAESPNPRAVLAPTSVTHYWGISPQAEHVYCLYSGRTPLEVGREFKAGTDHIFMEQYDWNGKPVKRYRLDHWGYFAVDEARRTVYVAAVNADEALYAYKF
jgi:hypothetical protein